MKKLYKKTSSGKIQEWVVVSEDNKVITRFGQLGSDNIQETIETVYGKNIGKKNETSDSKQAELRCNQLFDKKKKQGYVENLELARTSSNLLAAINPMLAFPMEKKEKHIQFPAYSQPKLDGMRCIAIIKDGVCELYTRTQKPITTIPHINQQIMDVCSMKGVSDIILDGELYNHELKHDFNRIISLIKRDNVHVDSELIEYHIYDTISNCGFTERNKSICDLKINNTLNLKQVETKIVTSRDNLDNYFSNCIERGYEGCMYRRSDVGYEFKRSTSLLKVKVFDDAEFEVVGVLEGKGKLTGSAGSIICKTKSGIEFKAKLKSHEDNTGKRIELKETFQERCKKWLVDIDNYKGKMLTVRFQGITPKRYKDGILIGGGVPRFPIALRLRIEE